MRGKYNRRKKGTASERPSTRRDDDRRGYTLGAKTNEQLETYYKTLDIVPDNEWDAFLDIMRSELPTTFRLTGTRKVAAELNEAIRQKYIPFLTGITFEDKPVEAPTVIPWYPNGLGWQLLCSKMVIKRSPEFKTFHRFLVAETEAGNISRQEAVSMIPPLLLDVQPHHMVLDMCAAPGSKTGQLIEALHTGDHDGSIPSGMVIANDADSRRAYMLVSQMQRLQSPCLVVTNHEAQHFPNIQFDMGLARGDQSKLQFDRILCDVPCSGDGTLRKNALIWQTWTMAQALGLHTTQISILARGCQLLRVGGRLVYSTCSMNPVENEAVVAAVLQRYAGSVQLVDVAKELPELQRRPGLASWKVMSKGGEWYEQFEDVPEEEHKFINASNFAPNDAASLNLDRCMRVYPHFQNTGAFFIAVFEKTAPITAVDFAKAAGIAGTAVGTEKNIGADTEDNATGHAKRSASPPTADQDNKRARSTSPPADAEKDQTDRKKDVVKKSRGGYQNPDGPFTLLSPDNASVSAICDYYQFSDAFPRDQLLVRSESVNNCKSIFFVSSTVKKFLTAEDIARFKLVHTGVRTFVRSDSNCKDAFPYRFQSDGLSVLGPLLPETRKIPVTLEDIRRLVAQQNPMIEEFSDQVKEQLDTMRPGCCILTFDPKPCSGLSMYEPICIPVWRARVSVNLLLSKEEKRALGFRVGLSLPLATSGKSDSPSAQAVQSDTQSESSSQVAISAEE